MSESSTITKPVKRGQEAQVPPSLPEEEEEHRGGRSSWLRGFRGLRGRGRGCKVGRMSDRSTSCRRDADREGADNEEDEDEEADEEEEEEEEDEEGEGEEEEEGEGE